MSNIEGDIRTLLLKAPWTVLYCPKCNPLILPLASDVQPHKSFPWAKQLRCYQCNAEWVVCNNCAISKKHITNRRQCLNHDRLYHRDILDGKRSKKKQCSSSEHQEVSIHDATEMQHDFIDNYDTSNVMDDIETSCYSVLAMVYDRMLCNSVTVGVATFNNFGNYNNKSFFELEHFNGVGMASLVCNASFHVTEGSSHILEQEIVLHLNITRMTIDRVLHAETRKHNKAHTEALEQDKDETIGLKKKMVHKYISLAHIAENYDNRKPLSMVQLCEGRFGCIIRTGNLFVELYCGSHAEFLGGSWYRNWTISRNAVQGKRLHTSSILHYCLLLPKLTFYGMPSREEDRMYMAITSEWLEMNE
jgi:hypothetical protein